MTQKQSTTQSTDSGTTSIAAVQQELNLVDQPWFEDPFSFKRPSAKFMINTSNNTFLGWWTYPYYLCSARKWQMTYSIPVSNAGFAMPTNPDR